MSLSRYLLGSSLMWLVRCSKHQQKAEEAQEEAAEVVEEVAEEVTEAEVQAGCSFVDEQYEMVLNFTTEEGVSVKHVIEFELSQHGVTSEDIEQAEKEVVLYTPCGEYLSNSEGTEMSLCRTVYSETGDRELYLKCEAAYGYGSNDYSYHYDEKTMTWTVEVEVQDPESTCPDHTRSATITWHCDPTEATYRTEGVETGDDDCDMYLTVYSSWACMEPPSTTPEPQKHHDQDSSSLWFFRGVHITRAFVYSLLFVGFLMTAVYCITGYIWTKEAMNPHGSWMDVKTNLPSQDFWSVSLSRFFARGLSSIGNAIRSGFFSSHKSRKMQPYNSVTPLIKNSSNSHVAYEQISDIEEL